MEQIPLLNDLALIVVVGVAAAVLLDRLRLPVIAGLIFAGALMGPYGLGWVDDVHQIEKLAEVGVVLLLFTIGLEFSLSRLARIAKLVALGGLLQVSLTTIAVIAVASSLGATLAQGVFLGFVFALSSTAIVLRSLQERGELDAPHGRFVVGALIFQDLAIVPMVLIVPILAGQQTGNPYEALFFALGKAALLVVFALLLARKLLPPLFHWVDRTRSRELFLLAVTAICIGTAWLTSQVGLSLALGAFLAGVVLSDSDFGHRALSDMLPLRDIFSSLFFISLGMLADMHLLLVKPVVIGLLFFAFLFGKGAIATLSALVMRFPARVAILAGVGLAQFGEFGFVIAKLGQSAGLIQLEQMQALLAAGVMSMFITPVLVRIAPHITAGERILRPLERLLGAQGIDEPAPEHCHMRRHVVITGYGIAGRLLAQALRESDIPYLILELNADTVRIARAEGEPIYYGDVTSKETMENACLHHALALVLLINDPEASRRAVSLARRIAPDVPVFLRARYVENLVQLRDLGATEVVFEELEAGLEVLVRVLRRAGLPANVIAGQMQAAREASLPGERLPSVPPKMLCEIEELTELKIEVFQVTPDSHANGRQLANLRLREEGGAMVVGLRHRGSLVHNPRPAQSLQEGDMIFLVGSRAAIEKSLTMLAQGPENPAPS
ncbi:MAG: cation:proton antiporter domain-containing protein [Alphaproteobacteria bacterium]